MAEGQYRVAIEWGYISNELIPNCSGDNCPICNVNTTCLDCKNHQTCLPIELPNDDDKERALAGGNRELGLAVGLGGPLFIAIVVIIAGTVVLMSRKS